MKQISVIDPDRLAFVKVYCLMIFMYDLDHSSYRMLDIFVLFASFIQLKRYTDPFCMLVLFETKKVDYVLFGVMWQSLTIF